MQAFLQAVVLAGTKLGMAIAANNPTMLYGLVEWPHIPAIFSMEPAAKERLHHLFEKSHTLLSYALYLLLALHLAGALKHQFIDRMPLLQRMWPARR